MKLVWALCLTIVTNANVSFVFAAQDNPNLTTDRSAIETIVTKKDDIKTMLSLYKDLDQDGVPDKIDHCPNTMAGIKVDHFGCELDSDKDGIYDSNDQCPNTPYGLPVNFLGCEGDADEDRVLDSKDLCPNTPIGTKVNAKGCKVDDDKDQDGVVDSRDLCPDTPIGQEVNANGCKPETYVITNIVFNSGSYIIRADQKPILDGDAAKLRELQSNEILVITGHTDSTGGELHNEKLSWHRAQSTKDYLVKTFNIPEQQVYVLGKGETEPRATNDTAEGRQLNRRISLDILTVDKVPAEARVKIPESMLGYEVRAIK